MKRFFVIGIAFFFFSINPRLTGANDDNSWSSPVNGLQARLSFERGKSLNGTPLVSTYLELRNVADIGNVMELPLNLDRILFEVVDERDRTLPQGPNVYDEVTVEVGMLRMPHDSYLRFNISHHGAGFQKTRPPCLTWEVRMYGCSRGVIDTRITCADNFPLSRAKKRVGQERLRSRKSKSRRHNRVRQRRVVCMK